MILEENRLIKGELKRFKVRLFTFTPIRRLITHEFSG